MWRKRSCRRKRRHKPPAAPNASSSSGTSSTSSMSSLTSESTFLQLLIAQIKNQDPLNPTDSIQFVGQLVQYSELEQLMGINQGVQTLTGAPLRRPAYHQPTAPPDQRLNLRRSRTQLIHNPQKGALTMSSFSIALSGLTADSAALDVVGNNLANLNTTGYKDSTVSFYDLLQQSVAGGSTQIGGGVSAPADRADVYARIHSSHRRELRRRDQRQRILRRTRSVRQHLVYPSRKFPARRQRQSGHCYRSVRARLVGAERRCEHQRRRSAISRFPPTRCKPPAPPRTCRSA